MMDAVIRWLIQGIASQAKAEKKYVEEHPLQTPTDDDALRGAIRLLEAAKGCDREAADLATSAIRHFMIVKDIPEDGQFYQKYESAIHILDQIPEAK